MKVEQKIAALRQHGIYEGRAIASSKTQYCRQYPKHLVVFNAQIFTPRGRILKMADLDITLDAIKLYAAAREVGENFYVLSENSPHPF
jgi:hypothetical protein